MIRIRTACLLATAVAVSTLALSPATGAVMWQLPGTDLSDTTANSLVPQIAVGPDGTATAIWTHEVGGAFIVQAATRAAGSSTFSAPVDLSAASGQARTPQIAFAADGATTVVWDRFDGTNYRVQATTRAAGANTFSAPVNVSASGSDASVPEVAIAPDGTTTAVWVLFNGTHDVVQTATRAAGASTFSAPVDLSDTTKNSYKPQVASGPGGTTTAVWTTNDGANDQVQAATRPAGSNAFGAAQPLSALAQNAREPRIGMGPNDQTTVVWQAINGTTFQIQATTRAGGSGSFAAPEDLSALGGDATNPSVAVGPDGTTTAAWFRNNGTNNIVQARTRAAGAGTFAASQDLSASGQSAYYPDVAAGPDGLAAIVWFRTNGTNDIVQAATRGRGATSFDPAVSLSADGQNAAAQQIAVAKDGTVTAVWRRPNGTKEVVQAASTDAQPKLAQKPLNKKGKAPKKIKKNGKTVITGKNAKTNAGNLIATKVKCTPKKKGGKRTCKVIHGSSGKVTLRTYGVPKVKVTVTQSAPETAAYLAYSKKTVYKNGKKKS